jgi:hypothetical protein
VISHSQIKLTARQRFRFCCAKWGDLARSVSTVSGQLISGREREGFEQARGTFLEFFDVRSVVEFDNLVGVSKNLGDVIEGGAVFEEADREGIAEAVSVAAGDVAGFPEAAKMLVEGDDGLAEFGGEDVR